MCTSCYRMLYKDTVVQFKPSRYTKSDSDLLISFMSILMKARLMESSGFGRRDGSLSRGVFPAQAKTNGMELEEMNLMS